MSVISAGVAVFSTTFGSLALSFGPPSMPSPFPSPSPSDAPLFRSSPPPFPPVGIAPARLCRQRVSQLSPMAWIWHTRCIHHQCESCRCRRWSYPARHWPRRCPYLLIAVLTYHSTLPDRTCPTGWRCTGAAQVDAMGAFSIAGDGTKGSAASAN